MWCAMLMTVRRTKRSVGELIFFVSVEYNCVLLPIPQLFFGEIDIHPTIHKSPQQSFVGDRGCKGDRTALGDSITQTYNSCACIVQVSTRKIRETEIPSDMVPTKW